MNESYRGSRMPALFIGHGSPMNIVQQNEFTKSLEEVKKKLPKPDCILVISAHWMTKGTYVTCSENLIQGFDFYGFPDELYRVQYNPKGSPDCARSVIQLSGPEGRIKCDYSRGLDHGSWAILKVLFPEADVPVIQMSIDQTKPPEYHYKLASKLSILRDRKILVIGSGNIVHNLRSIDFKDMDAEPFSWAVEFDMKVKGFLKDKMHSELLNYKQLGNVASMSVPTPEHYLPLLYVIGMQGESDELNFIYEGFQNKAVSMRSFIIG
ncbi:MAG: 4,5-DOPA dioxygenase extradiol [Bacteroidota bacterium]|nr:4,5-DOPA dioxygenase extradiol [Bacteroidota bacterium]MDP4192364.1 4,5-DOPA dioxygenase extradiol [Bacteroidota bacterium]MDP4194329.1 4,5-DOPA dioxygenase extradiol [Bacteroidota bacterium]